MSLSLDKSTWKHVAFGDVVRNVNETLRDPESAGIDRVIAMEHMEPGELKIERWGLLDDGTTFTRRVKPGQTLFGKRRAYQRKVAYAEFDAICSGDILTFETDETQMLAEFLPFLVQSNEFFDHALDTSAGSLSPRTNWRDLSTFEFDLPPIDEQKRISDTMWTIVRHRHALKRQSQRTSEVIDRFLDTAFAAISEHRALSVGVDASAYGPRFSSSLYSETAEYRLLRTTDMDPLGNVDYSTMPRADLTASYDSHLLRDGDFLISRSGTCGVAAVFDSSAGGDKVIPGAFLIRLRLNESLDPFYLRAFINSRPGREITGALAQGGVQKNIRGSSLLQARIPCPSRSEQQKLLGTLGKIEAAQRATQREFVAAATLGMSLSAAVFGGN